MSSTDYSLLTRVFSRSLLTEFSSSRTIQNTAFSTAVENFITEPYNKTNADIFDNLYDILKREYRNEYYYKNTLLNKLLLGVHSTRTTTALTELPIGKSKADFILINGKAVVYEIKTELDNFERLDEQVRNYYKAFNHVVVVSCETNKEILFEKYRGTPVGLFIINKVGNISKVKLPELYSGEIELPIVFSLLRKYEYENILRNFYLELPSNLTFDYYDNCQQLFCKLEKDKAYKATIQQLKLRKRNICPIFYKIPKSIKALGYFEALTNSQFVRLEQNLEMLYGR